MPASASSLSASPRFSARALVTGAASGIGRALAEALLARAYEVLAVDIEPLGWEAEGLIPLQLDVADAAAQQALAARHAGQGLDLLFANAGIAAPGPLMAGDTAQGQRAWAVNTLGPLHTLRAWWPQLRQARGRAVVTVSAAALLTYPGAAWYRASKAALLSLLESLYYETREDGVRLHALCPGLVRTAIVEHALAARGVASAEEGIDPFTAWLREALRHAEAADDFTRRVLDGLEQAPFYWLTHPEVAPGAHTRLSQILAAGHPALSFGELQ